MLFILTLWLCKLIAAGIHLLDRSRGSSYSGMIALRLMPDFVRRFKGIDPAKVVFITGTNGKSTSTNLVAHTMAFAGKKIASNVEGANIPIL